MSCGVTQTLFLIFMNKSSNDICKKYFLYLFIFRKNIDKDVHSHVFRV